MSSPTLIIGDGKWAVKSGSLLGYEYGELSGQFNPIPITGSRASTATYTNQSGLIVSASSGVLRVDYSTGTGSLLVEPQRTNIFLQSENFDSVSWTKQDVTVTADSTTSPDGSTNADTIVASSTTANHDVNQLISITSGVTYSISAYFKKGTTRYVYIQSQTTGASGFAVFDLDTATFTQQTTYVGSFSSVGSGWYRVTATFTATATASVRIRFGLTNSSTNPTSTLTTSDNVFLWGAQLEAGAFPTTYIPTTSTSVTRIADTFSRSNIYTDGVITSAGGTWLVELVNNISYTSTGFLRFGVGDTNTLATNSLFVRTVSTSRISISKIISGSSATLYNTLTDVVRIAIKWNGTSADVFVNGTKEVSATPFTTTNMEFLNGEVNSPAFIPQSKLYNQPLSDAECISLTTL